MNFYPPVFNRKTGKKTRYEKTSYFVYNEFQSETVYYTDANGKKQSKIEILTDKNSNPKKLTLTPAQKQHNRETNEMVELYRAKRFKEIINPDIYTEAELKALELAENKSNIFTEYFKEKAQNATSSEGAWSGSYGHFVKLCGNILFQDINKALIEDFKTKSLNAYQLRIKLVEIQRQSTLLDLCRF